MQKLLLLSLFSILFTANLSAKTIRYVKTDGTGDGSSWANASNSIQAMIDNSSTGDEDWVAKGIYFPATETIARDARSPTFLVKSGGNIHGGFAGPETPLTQRQLADLDANGKIDSCELVNKTILSGDIDGATDVWIKTTNTDGTWKWTIAGNNGNCYRVVTGEYRTTIEGFTVIGGNGVVGRAIVNSIDSDVSNINIIDINSSKPKFESREEVCHQNMGPTLHP